MKKLATIAMVGFAAAGLALAACGGTSCDDVPECTSTTTNDNSTAAKPACEDGSKEACEADCQITAGKTAICDAANADATVLATLSTCKTACAIATAVK